MATTQPSAASTGLRRITCAALLTFAGIAVGCAGAPLEDTYRPYVDISFVPTGNIETNTLGTNSSVLVSDISGSFEIRELGFFPATGLNRDGQLVAANANLLEIEFLAPGQIEIMSIDERVVTLRLQIERDGTITRGWLSGEIDNVSSAARKLTPDVFMDGHAKVMYHDDKFAVGHIVANFNGHTIEGNFRALTKRR
jgi:hypothetical protein